VTIETKDVIAYYKNTIKTQTLINITNGVLPNKQLRNIIGDFDKMRGNLEQIKPSKGKTTKHLVVE
jgi:hypothetical protein